MLISQEWSIPKKLEYGKNIILQFSKPGFTIRIFSEDGSSKEQDIIDGKEYEIRATEISSISHPLITFKSFSKEEIHVRVEDPVY